MSVPQLDRHVHWKFTAWNGLSPEQIVSEDQKMTWVVQITVIGYETEEDARIAARAILPRDHFALRDVWECQSCAAQSSTSQSLHELVKASK